MSDADPAKKLFAPEPAGPATDPGRLSDAELRKVHAESTGDKEEPTVGFSPIPVAMIMLFTALTFWVAIYIGQHAGGFRWNVYDANWEPGGETAAAPPDPMKIGARVFKNTCQQCHHEDGLGAAGQYPPLAGSPWVAGTPDRAIEIMLEGLGGPATILGNDYNAQMPALGQSLSDADIAAALTYVRGSFGNTASAVDEQEVAQIRASLGARSPMTPDEELRRHPLGQPDNTVAAKPAAVAGNTTTGSAQAAGTPVAGNTTAGNVTTGNAPAAGNATLGNLTTGAK